jgi:hypothetical protein
LVSFLTLPAPGEFQFERRAERIVAECALKIDAVPEDTRIAVDAIHQLETEAKAALLRNMQEMTKGSMGDSDFVKVEIARQLFFFSFLLRFVFATQLILTSK